MSLGEWTTLLLADVSCSVDKFADTVRGRQDLSMAQSKPLHGPTIRTTHFCIRGQIQPRQCLLISSSSANRKIRLVIIIINWFDRSSLGANRPVVRVQSGVCAHDVSRQLLSGFRRKHSYSERQSIALHLSSQICTSVHGKEKFGWTSEISGYNYKRNSRWNY